jgi:hypothetical protein
VLFLYPVRRVDSASQFETWVITDELDAFKAAVAWVSCAGVAVASEAPRLESTEALLKLGFVAWAFVSAWLKASSEGLVDGGITADPAGPLVGTVTVGV